MINQHFHDSVDDHKAMNAMNTSGIKRTLSALRQKKAACLIVGDNFRITRYIVHDPKSKSKSFVKRRA